MATIKFVTRLCYIKHNWSSVEILLRCWLGSTATATLLAATVLATLPSFASFRPLSLSLSLAGLVNILDIIYQNLALCCGSVINYFL